jgi:hypothetical protein
MNLQEAGVEGSLGLRVSHGVPITRDFLTSGREGCVLQRLCLGGASS